MAKKRTTGRSANADKKRTAPKLTKAEQRRRTALAAVRHLRKSDPRMAAIIDHVGPHRLVLIANPFDALASSIVSQQISMKAAESVRNKLLDRCPRRKLTAKAILALGEDDLRAAGLSRQKTRYMRSLAEHFDGGHLSSRKLRRLDDEQVIAETTQVIGIGRWTAEMLLMFCLDRPDVWPIDDLGLRKAVRNYLAGGDDGRDRGADRAGKSGADGVLPDAKTMQAAGEAFRPYRTFASWYLWRSLEGPFMPGVTV